MSDIKDLLDAAEEDFSMKKTAAERGGPQLPRWLAAACENAIAKFPDSAEIFKATRDRMIARLSMSSEDRRRDRVKERMERRAEGYVVRDPMDCKFCDNTGFQIEFRLRAGETDLLHGYEVAVPCSCRRHPRDPRDPTPGTTKRSRRASSRRAGRKPVKSWKDAAAGDGREDEAEERRAADAAWAEKEEDTVTGPTLVPEPGEEEDQDAS